MSNKAQGPGWKVPQTQLSGSGRHGYGVEDTFRGPEVSLLKLELDGSVTLRGLVFILGAMRHDEAF